jgi:hypothetical protein
MCDHLPDNGGCNPGQFCDDKGGCIANCKDSDCNAACSTAGLTGGACVVAAFCQCAPSPAPGIVSGSALLFGHTASDAAHDHSGITVALAGTQMMATTNPDGSFSIPGVPPGVYAVTYSKTKYLPENRPSVTVAPAMTTLVPDVTLNHGKHLGPAPIPGNIICGPFTNSAAMSPDQTQVGLVSGDPCLFSAGGLIDVTVDGSRPPALLDGAATQFWGQPDPMQLSNTHVVFQPRNSATGQFDLGIWSRPLTGATDAFRLMPVPTPAGSLVDIVGAPTPPSGGVVTGSAKFTVIHKQDNTPPATTPNSWTAFKVDGSGTPATVWQQSATTDSVLFISLDDTFITFARIDSTGAATGIHSFNLTTSTDNVAALPAGTTTVTGPFSVSPDHAFVIGNFTNTNVPTARTFLYKLGATTISTSTASGVANTIATPSSNAPLSPLSDSTGFVFTDSNAGSIFFWGATVVPSPNPIQLVAKANLGGGQPQVIGKVIGYTDAAATNFPKVTSIPTAGNLVPFTSPSLDTVAPSAGYFQVVKDASGNEVGANAIFGGGANLQFKGVSITFPLTAAPTVGVLGQPLTTNCSTDLANNKDTHGVLNGAFFYWCNDAQTLSRFAPPFNAPQAKTDVDTGVVAGAQALNGALRVAYRKADGTLNSADATSKAVLSRFGGSPNITLITSNPWVFLTDQSTGTSVVSLASGGTIDEPLTGCAMVTLPNLFFGAPNAFVQPQKFGNNVISPGDICPGNRMNPYIVATANLP